jgi:hypothetical protein
MAGRFYSAEELIDIYTTGGAVPVPWHRQPNAGQLCAQCKRPVGHRAITDSISVWHVECNKSFTPLSAVNPVTSPSGSPPPGGVATRCRSVPKVGPTKAKKRRA